MHRCRPPSAGSARKLPVGVCTSTVSPGRTSCTSQRREQPVRDLAHTRPAASPRRARRSSRSGGARRRRRTGAASATARRRSRRRRAGRRVRRRSPRPRRRCSGSTAATVSSWNWARVDRRSSSRSTASETVTQISLTCSNGSRHDVQRYIALHAVGPNSEVSSTSRRAAARAGQRRVVSASGWIGTGPSCARCRPGRGEAVLRQGASAALGDPVAGPGGVQADPHLDVAEPVVAAGGARGRRASWPSPGSRSTSA